MIRHHHSDRKEGLAAGLLGAAAVAVWFLGVDLAGGRALATPNLLGKVLLFWEANPTPDLSRAAVVGYTVAHLLAFAGIGLLAAKLIRLATIRPYMRMALFLVLLFFEFFFALFAYAINQATGQQFPVGQVLAANLVAAVVMGFYLWRRHPALRRSVHRDPLGLEATH